MTAFLYKIIQAALLLKMLSDVGIVCTGVMVHALRLDSEECAPSISSIQPRFLSEIYQNDPYLNFAAYSEFHIATYLPLGMKNNSGL
jgi:hypothetical protein